MKKTAKKAAQVKNVGGRPKLEDGKRRDKWLQDVRFSTDELAALKERAAEDGVSWSAWVRQRLGI